MESRDYLKLKRLIEQLDAKTVGSQTKFELRFNLDLAFNTQDQRDTTTFITGDGEEDSLRLR